ncbi:sulfur oxidation c-type cytochrome SoxA [Polymorphum gilvum]|uniref:SoxAX cytochrome complex subunit A n=1 Tax=Polymorphum gilvum (strain LMG 25793 / CGMCC 1.9160 / SL003B-26A1) TaxID=991905 RepID=F2J561_POLGS|nr:sulfur oxidation c-type cytochrome SoxA [Polymorphum gilvum]ADZ71120.1 Sulfur oxidation protein (SoxA) [Polymorphum gilvum SL003B-26A1]
MTQCRPSHPKRLGAVAGALALIAAATTGSGADELEEYKRMLADPFANPGWLYADEGEALWNTPSGPKNATLEQCDLGLGAGVVEGAYAQLPRYFADVDRVMDVETRIAWCREELQGIPFAETAKSAFSKRGAKSQMEQLVVYVASKSEGMPITVPMTHEKEQEALALGEALFYRRSSVLDYSCSTCHSIDGARIRLQDLPNLTDHEGAASAMTSWPTYRVSHESVRTMQHRMWDCYWQMRMPDVAYGSDVTVALIAYMTKVAEGAEMASPGLKR